MEGSTFANLGMFGIVEFNSIINQPNSANLSVGAIVENQWLKTAKLLSHDQLAITVQ
jgi:pyruvate dehydrogenase E2 component (dihydrolipoamide acetyltransferase)